MPTSNQPNQSSRHNPAGSDSTTRTTAIPPAANSAAGDFQPLHTYAIGVFPDDGLMEYFANNHPTLQPSRNSTNGEPSATGRAPSESSAQETTSDNMSTAATDGSLERSSNGTRIPMSIYRSLGLLPGTSNYAPLVGAADPRLQALGGFGEREQLLAMAALENGTEMQDVDLNGEPGSPHVADNHRDQHPVLRLRGGTAQGEAPPSVQKFAENVRAGLEDEDDGGDNAGDNAPGRPLAQASQNNYNRTPTLPTPALVRRPAVRRNKRHESARVFVSALPAIEENAIDTGNRDSIPLTSVTVDTSVGDNTHPTGTDETNSSNLSLQISPGPPPYKLPSNDSGTAETVEPTTATTNDALHASDTASINGPTARSTISITTARLTAAGIPTTSTTINMPHYTCNHGLQAPESPGCFKPMLKKLRISRVPRAVRMAYFWISITLIIALIVVCAVKSQNDANSPPAQTTTSKPIRFVEVPMEANLRRTHNVKRDARYGYPRRSPLLYPYPVPHPHASYGGGPIRHEYLDGSSGSIDDVYPEYYESNGYGHEAVKPVVVVTSTTTITASKLRARASSVNGTEVVPIQEPERYWYQSFEGEKMFGLGDQSEVDKEVSGESDFPRPTSQAFTSSNFPSTFLTITRTSPTLSPSAFSTLSTLSTPLVPTSTPSSLNTIPTPSLHVPSHPRDLLLTRTLTQITTLTPTYIDCCPTITSYLPPAPTYYFCPPPLLAPVSPFTPLPRHTLQCPYPSRGGQPDTPAITATVTSTYTPPCSYQPHTRCRLEQGDYCIPKTIYISPSPAQSSPPCPTTCPPLTSSKTKTITHIALAPSPLSGLENHIPGRYQCVWDDEVGGYRETSEEEKVKMAGGPGWSWFERNVERPVEGVVRLLKQLGRKAGKKMVGKVRKGLGLGKGRGKIEQVGGEEEEGVVGGKDVEVEALVAGVLGA